MTGLFATLLIFLGPAGAPECTDAFVSALFNQEQYRDAAKAAMRCASPAAPQFYYFAAQAEELLKNWSMVEQRSLKFLALAPKNHPDRGLASKMLANARRKLKPPPPTPPITPITPDTTGTTGATGTTGTTGATGPVTTTLPGTTPKKIEPVLDDDEPLPRNDPPPDRTPTRLWLGLGLSAGGGAIVATVTGLVGSHMTNTATTDNANALKSAGLSSAFDIQDCVASQGVSPQCDKVAVVDERYPSDNYYRELSGGLTRESVGAGLGAASLGVLVGALPGLAKGERGRRIGLGVMVGAGVAMVAGGAVLAAGLHDDLQPRFDGFNPTASSATSWRDIDHSYAGLHRNYLLSAALSGLGVGVLIGGVTSLAVLWKRGPRRPGDSAARVRVSPTLRGLIIHGRF